VQRPLTSGPRGWLTDQSPWPTGRTLQPLVGWLRGDTLQEAVEGNPNLKVGGDRTPKFDRLNTNLTVWGPRNSKKNLFF
jgi:hypothetical protein